MAEKKVIGSTLIAKAVARVKEGKNFKGKWGAGEHLACIRYVAVDAIPQAVDMVNKKTAGPDGKPLDLANALNLVLKTELAKDPEFSYASNFEKLLKRSGEIESDSDYE